MIKEKYLCRSTSTYGPCIKVFFGFFWNFFKFLPYRVEGIRCFFPCFFLTVQFVSVLPDYKFSWKSLENSFDLLLLHRCTSALLQPLAAHDQCSLLHTLCCCCSFHYLLCLPLIAFYDCQKSSSSQLHGGLEAHYCRCCWLCYFTFSCT